MELEGVFPCPVAKSPYLALDHVRFRFANRQFLYEPDTYGKPNPHSLGSHICLKM